MSVEYSKLDNLNMYGEFRRTVTKDKEIEIAYEVLKDRCRRKTIKGSAISNELILLNEEDRLGMYSSFNKVIICNYEIETKYEWFGVEKRPVFYYVVASTKRQGSDIDESILLEMLLKYIEKYDVLEEYQNKHNKLQERYENDRFAYYEMDNKVTHNDVLFHKFYSEVCGECYSVEANSNGNKVIYIEGLEFSGKDSFLKMLLLLMFKNKDLFFDIQYLSNGIVVGNKYYESTEDYINDIENFIQKNSLEAKFNKEGLNFDDINEMIYGEVKQ